MMQQAYRGFVSVQLNNPMRPNSATAAPTQSHFLYRICIFPPNTLYKVTYSISFLLGKINKKSYSNKFSPTAKYFWQSRKSFEGVAYGTIYDDSVDFQPLFQNDISSHGHSISIRETYSFQSLCVNCQLTTVGEGGIRLFLSSINKLI